MKVIRSLAAVAAGCAVAFGLLRGLAPAPSDSANMTYFLLSVTWTVLGALAGGFVAAFIAGSHEIPHAGGVGFVMILMSIASMRQHGASRPGWYETTVAGCGPVAAMIGAALRMLTKRRARY